MSVEQIKKTHYEQFLELLKTRKISESILKYNRSLFSSFLVELQYNQKRVEQPVNDILQTRIKEALLHKAAKIKNNLSSVEKQQLSFAGKKGFEVKLDQQERENVISENIVDHMPVGTISTFKEHGANIYKIARNFGEHLFKINLNIQAKFLPKKICYCIEFPENIRFEHPPFFEEEIKALKYTLPKKTYITCVYVFSDEDEIVLTDDRKIVKYLYYYMPHMDENGKLVSFSSFEHGQINWFSEDENLDEVLERHNKVSTVQAPEGFLEYMIKCILYINSGDPDLRPYKAPAITTNKPKHIRRFLKQHENQSLVDVTLVGYDFKKPKLYKVDETWVETFPRWQPYGPGRGKIKLIWVAPHSRHYKLTAKEVDEQFDDREALTDFFTEELDPETYQPKKK